MGWAQATNAEHKELQLGVSTARNFFPSVMQSFGALMTQLHFPLRRSWKEIQPVGEKCKIYQAQKNHLRSKWFSSAAYLQALALRVFPEPSLIPSVSAPPAKSSCQGTEAVDHSTCPQILEITVRKTIMRLPLHSSSSLCLLFTSPYFLMRSGAPSSHSNICTFFHIVMDLPRTHPSLLSHMLCTAP